MSNLFIKGTIKEIYLHKTTTLDIRCKATVKFHLCIHTIYHVLLLSTTNHVPIYILPVS